MMKHYIIKTAFALAMGLVVTGCDDMFGPAVENNLGLEYMYKSASYAEGVLGNAYTRIPAGNITFSEVATDDAVSNDAGNAYRKIATGAWTSNYNPTDQWIGCRAAIMYINIFLANADQVKWADDEIAAQMYLDREKGEAYGLRALFNFYLLQAHAGVGADGELLGIPLIYDVESADEVGNQKRATFEESVKAIYEDCNRAEELLPVEYRDITDAADIPAKYAALGATVSQYNRVFGAGFKGRVSGNIVEAYRAKTALMAASPAFGTTSWKDAAELTAVVLDRIGGVGGMDSRGWKWYSNTSQIDGLSNGACPAEILWRAEKFMSNSWEKDNYPPSLYGSGRVNPTQNFVDAFPMANGYPIAEDESEYDPENPYSKRDPRLEAFVLYNGGKAGVNNTVISTAADGETQDALNRVSGSSTRTGFYLKKLLRQDINLDPVINSQQYHYVPRIRFTEMFLNYAEAANEAYGPTATGGHKYSAYDVIKAIRKRAGVGTSNGDAYLESIKDNKDKMRQLIRNERRIELSFEGFRFWDLRRWKAELNETARGTSISGGIHSPIDVETRSYKDYMIYGPIPRSETLKFSELIQNKGW